MADLANSDLPPEEAEEERAQMTRQLRYNLNIYSLILTLRTAKNLRM